MICGNCLIFGYKPLRSHHLPKCCRKLDLRSLKEVVMVLPFDDSIAMRDVNKNAVMWLAIWTFISSPTPPQHPPDLYILYMENYKFIYGFTFRWRVKFKPLDRTWFGCAFPILNLLSSSLYKFSASCITIFVSQGIEKSQLTFCC